MSLTLEENQPREQAGFRKGWATTDHIHAVSQIIEKSKEYGITLYICFIDFTKAFDTIEHSEIWKSLKQQGIEKAYIEVLYSIYSQSEAKIKLEKIGPEFSIEKGVRQGDPLSPKIFTAVLETIFRNIDWSNKGININGEYLSHLRFADDIVLFAECPKILNDMILELALESKKIGLSLNKSKTKIMTNGDKQQQVIVEGEVIEVVNEYIYLGQLLSFENHIEKEVQRRIALAWKKYWSLKEIMKNKDISIRLKAKLYNVAILPCLIYGCQTWALRKADEEKIAVCQRKIERSILGIKVSDKISNQRIRRKTGLSDAIRQIRLLQWKWAGHICRASTTKWAKILTEWVPRSGKRKRGRPRKRWADPFARINGPLWMRNAKDRKTWRMLGEAYANEATSTVTQL